MTNNDILRRLRYTFDYSNTKMIGIFRHADMAVTRVQLTSWMNKEDDAEYVRLTDQEMATFLNGLIVEKRGRQDGPQPVAERQVNNNIIFRKLKIALNLNAEDILEMLKLAGVSLSKHELSALFRKQGHQNYRECKDQVLRNFLSGLQYKLRDKAPQQDSDKPLRKTASVADQSGAPVRKRSQHRSAASEREFIVDKPAADKSQATPVKESSPAKTENESNSVWAKALAKSSKKHD